MVCGHKKLNLSLKYAFLHVSYQDFFLCILLLMQENDLVKKEAYLL